MKTLQDCRLYTIVDTAYLGNRPITEVALRLCESGSDLIQLRAKNQPLAEVRRLAELIKPITDQAGVPLVINDHLTVAIEVETAFCHLGQEDFFNAGHRQVTDVLPTESAMRIGLSSHAPDQAERAVQAGAAYLGVGPVYSTGTKPSAQPVTLQYVRWAAANLTLPWFAIGGIHLNNLEEVLAAGARRICVVSAILNAPDVGKACQEFRKRLTSPP
jgi:thiamine-phosphate pyrophosphorylase